MEVLFEKKRKMKTQTIIQLTTILTIFSFTQAQCLVDKCASCPSATVNTCNSCESGWYKRTFTGGDKEYDECWSLTKLWLGVIGALLLSLLLCGLCYYCYLMGKKTRLVQPTTARRGPLVTEPAYVKEQPVIVQQPRVVSSPQ